MAMGRFEVLTFVLGVCFGGVVGLDMPSYMKACHRNDPNINECITNSARAAIPYLESGDRVYGIPPTDPLFLQELVVQQGTGPVSIKIEFKNFHFVGLKDVDVKSARADIEKGKMFLVLTTPKFTVVGPYKVSGRILLLPIQGEGNGSITFADVGGNMTLNFIKIKKKNGLEYAKIKNTDWAVSANGMVFKLENLFNGNKLLGNQMNEFLTNNWEEVFVELKPVIERVLDHIATTIIDQVFAKIPYESFHPKSTQICAIFNLTISDFHEIWGVETMHRT